MGKSWNIRKVGNLEFVRTTMAYPLVKHGGEIPALNVFYSWEIIER